jgi:zinc/manganese transport system substrate-binding protein
MLSRINEATLVLRHGIHLDEWLDGAIEGAGGDATVVQVTEGIEVRTDTDGAEDPHVWHNPEFAAVMLENVAQALIEADPDNAALFRERADAYKARLQETDSEVREILSAIPPANRKIVTNHDAFGYFIDHYDLEFVAAVIPSANKDAQVSADELAALQDLIRSEGVAVIFAEEEVDPAIARQLARDAGVQIVEGLYADSLGEPGSGADTIHGMLLFNARKIAEALE